MGFKENFLHTLISQYFIFSDVKFPFFILIEPSEFKSGIGIYLLLNPHACCTMFLPCSLYVVFFLWWKEMLILLHSLRKSIR